MKVTITALKAPWPAGANVGDVVQIDGDALPAWAVGKCVPAPDDAEVAFVVTNASAPAGGAPATADDARIAQSLADVEAQARSERSAASSRRRGG